MCVREKERVRERQCVCVCERERESVGKLYGEADQRKEACERLRLEFSTERRFVCVCV